MKAVDEYILLVLFAFLVWNLNALCENKSSLSVFPETRLALASVLGPFGRTLEYISVHLCIVMQFNS